MTGSIPNAPTLASLRADLDALAKTGGAGKDVQIKAALKVVEAAYLGTIDLAPNKHGTGITDATLLAEDFVKNYSGALIFDTKAPTSKKLIACFNTIIKFGGVPKWGQGQPMQVVNDFLTARQRARAKGGKKLEDAFNAFMRFIRAQLKEDTILTTAEFDKFIYKKDSEPRTARDVLDVVRNTIIKLRKGQIANCPDKDDSPETQQILSLCNQRIGKLGQV